MRVYQNEMFLGSNKQRSWQKLQKLMVGNWN